MSLEASTEQPATGPPPEHNPARISVSRGFTEFLGHHALSLAASSYQTGQLLLIGALPSGHLSVHQRNFVRAMGLCTADRSLYLATVTQIWRLENVLRPGQLANQYFDRLFVPRASYVTGDIDIHDIGVDAKGDVLFVNTKYSCIAGLSRIDSFKPLWKPPFVSSLAPEDRCHLNGLAMRDGEAAM